MAHNMEHETQNLTQRKPPHEVLFLILTYLPLFDLLSISETCTSMRDAVINDVLPWLRITVNGPSSYRLSDQILMKYASRANGRLKSLALVKCVKITDYGLQQVIEQNPFISKLDVPGCTGLTPDGIVTVVTTLSKHSPSLTSLKINGIYNINQHHLQTLRSILMSNIKNNHFVSSQRTENDTPIDVDLCPKCDQVRLVFVCSEDNCSRKKKLGVRECRGCSYCIARCVDCGKCINEEEEVEVACGDNLCLGCWLKLPKCGLCNTPYCKSHAELRYIHAASEGCHGCIAKYSRTNSYD